MKAHELDQAFDDAAVDIIEHLVVSAARRPKSEVSMSIKMWIAERLDQRAS